MRAPSGSPAGADDGSSAPPDQARTAIAAFEAAGVERLVLQTFVPRDLEMIRQAGRLIADWSRA